jgi:polysaccharide biosynthesis protein PslG
VVLALLALAVGTPPGRASAAGGGAPLMVFNANFVRGASAAERVASYRRLRAVGVRAVRLDFNWASLEPVGRPLHDYRWRAQDREVRIIRRAGPRVLGILAYGHPDYSRAGGEAYKQGQKPIPPFGIGDPQYYPPDNPRTFARFAADVARRYRRSVAGWEVWNEENEGWRFWEPREDPAAYGRLLCAARRSLGRADPGAPVAFGGMFFPPFVGTGAVKFLDQVLTAGGRGIGRCFDAVGYHPYPYPFTSPEAVAGRGSVIGGATQLRRVLSRHGLARKPLWNTEVGWPTNPRGNGVTERRQARYVARLALLSWGHRVSLVTWYTWGDYHDPSGTNQEAHFGFFREDGRAKPAYRAFRTLHRVLGGRGWRYAGDRARALGLPRGRGGVGRGYALAFRGPCRRRLLALWYANERPPADPSPFARVEPGTPVETIAVRLPVGTRAAVTGLLGSRRRLAPRGGRIRLNVGQDPLFVAWRVRPVESGGSGAFP